MTKIQEKDRPDQYLVLILGLKLLKQLSQVLLKRVGDIKWLVVLLLRKKIFLYLEIF